MIAIFASREDAQTYCDERAKARGLPNETTERWDTPHAVGDGTFWARVDPRGETPNVTIQDAPPNARMTWDPPTPEELATLRKTYEQRT